ncbi:MAG: NOL1/NOP2/sun family putative RNA methylase [Clostridia bacterium]|nr:NOL1/NOP2/sun family putative RNA methylase [Clostridia bacterium]
MKTLPDEFLYRMKSILKDDLENYIKAINSPVQRAFRVNTDKISLEDFIKINDLSTEKIDYVDTGFYFEKDKIGNHPFHHAGLIYVQEPAAMLPAESLEINPDWCVLDMCAAPGGKSSQLKNKLGEKGILVSNEIISSRCKILTGNIERLGFLNTVTCCLDSEKIAKTFPNTFDLIMVDAPCSGEGMFRKDDNAILEWSIDNVKKCAERQKEILRNAVKALKPNGYIVYATCTFSLEENEMVIDNFLKENPDFELMPLTEKVQKATARGIKFEGCECENIAFCGRAYPHKIKGEGQFVALLHNKNEQTNTPPSKPQAIYKPDKILLDFLNDTLTEFDESAVKLYNGRPVYFPPDFYIPDSIAFSFGVTIGEIKKNYILPHHQFFTSLGKNFNRKVELSGDREKLEKYLHGEEISADIENGYVVITFNGAAVGGGKAVNGKIKNHYPKGLRKF